MFDRFEKVGSALNQPYKILLVEARFYDDLSDALAKGATQAIEKAGGTACRVSVPGALEIPTAIAIAADTGRYDAYVALGCVIRGETTHYDIVSNESCRAIMNLSVERRLAIGNGIQTVENRDQAWARADPERKNKGGGAAEAALAILKIKEQLAMGKIT